MYLECYYSLALSFPAYTYLMLHATATQALMYFFGGEGEVISLLTLTYPRKERIIYTWRKRFLSSSSKIFV